MSLAQFMQAMQQASQQPTIGQRFMQGQRAALEQQEQELLMQELQQRMQLRGTAEERAQQLHEIETNPELIESRLDVARGQAAVGRGQQQTAEQSAQTQLETDQANLDYAQTRAQYAGPQAQADLDAKRSQIELNRAKAREVAREKGYQPQSPTAKLLEDIVNLPEGDPRRDVLIRELEAKLGKQEADAILADTRARTENPEYDMHVLRQRRDNAQTQEEIDYYDVQIQSRQEQERLKRITENAKVDDQLASTVQRDLATALNLPVDDRGAPIFPENYSEVYQWTLNRAKQVGVTQAIAEAAERFTYESGQSGIWMWRAETPDRVRQKTPEERLSPQQREAYAKYRREGMSEAEAFAQLEKDEIQTNPAGSPTPNEPPPPPPGGIYASPQTRNPTPTPAPQPAPPPTPPPHNPYADEETRYGGIDETISTLRVDLADKTMTKEEAAQILKDLKDENRISQRDYVRAMRELRLGTWGD